MPQSALKTVPPAARIGRADVELDFAPSFEDLLGSGEPELIRELGSARRTCTMPGRGSV